MHRLPLILSAAALSLAVAVAPALGGRFDDKPALRAMLGEMRSELDLTDRQSEEAGALIEGQLERADRVVDELEEDVTFDSVVDLLVEARAIRNDFMPQLRALLDDDQKAKFDSLPKNDEVYIQGAVGWFADRRAEKLRRRLDLSDEQMPRVREILIDQFRDSVEIIEGVESPEGAKREILDAVVDLRGSQRRARREIDKLLDDGQRLEFQK